MEESLLVSCQGVFYLEFTPSNYPSEMENWQYSSSASSFDVIRRNRGERKKAPGIPSPKVSRR